MKLIELLLPYDDKSELLLSNGDLYIMSHQKQENVFDEYVKHTYPNQGWGVKSGTTRYFYKTWITPERFSKAKEITIANGETITFWEASYISNVAGFGYHQFAFINEKCISCCTSPIFDNFFTAWQNKVIQDRCALIA
jgi:hypothetical protein